MDTLNQKRERRFLFLKTLYEALDGRSETGWVSMWDVGESLGMDRREASSIMDYLDGEGLARHMAMGGGVTITHYGVKHVEDAILHPDRETQYFPAANVIQIQNMTNSNIMQDTRHSTQTVTYGAAEAKSIEEFLNELKVKLPQLELKQIDKEAVEGDIATIEAQMNSPRPKYTFVGECLKSIKTVLEGAAGSVLSTALLAMFPHLPQ